MIYLNLIILARVFKMCQSHSKKIDLAIKKIEPFAEENLIISDSVRNTAKLLITQLNALDHQISLRSEWAEIDEVILTILTEITSNNRKKVYTIQEIRNQLEEVIKKPSDNNFESKSDYSCISRAVAKMTVLLNSICDILSKFSIMLFYGASAGISGSAVGAVGAAVLGLPVAHVALVGGVSGAVGALTVNALYSFFNTPKSAENLSDKILCNTQQAIVDFQNAIDTENKENKKARYGAF